VLSAKAKRRQEKALDRAGAVMDIKEKKVEKSKRRARNVQERSKAWEELNKKMLAKKAREEPLEKENWVDEEEGDDMEADVEVGDAPAAPVVEAAKSVPLPAPAEDDDEIL
jgi:hypothetical protein